MVKEKCKYFYQDNVLKYMYSCQTQDQLYYTSVHVSLGTIICIRNLDPGVPVPKPWNWIAYLCSYYFEIHVQVGLLIIHMYLSGSMQLPNCRVPFRRLAVLRRRLLHTGPFRGPHFTGCAGCL